MHNDAQNPPHSPSRQQAEVWLTTADQSALLRQQPPLVFGEPGGGLPRIEVDSGRSYQPMEGFGFALTGGSAYLINRLPAPDKEALLRQLFLPDGEGIGTSYLRVSIGASDLSEASFTYDDLPPGDTDPDLARFDIFAGDADVIPLLQQILAVNPAIKIMASAWTAPPWMKTNGSYIGGGLKPDCYRVYASYFVKYVQAMNAHGIPIHAITPQNEPLNAVNEPSLVMEAGEQADFIKNHLGPALRDAGLGDVELVCWDFNCDGKDYPLAVLADPVARQFVAGVAWHLYAGDIAVLSEVHAAHPEIKTYFTEQWVGADGKFADDLRWHMKNIIIGATRNWSRVVLEWNLASAPHPEPRKHPLEQGPHTPQGCYLCLGAVSLDGGINRHVAYYAIAHAAKFVRPGSVRIYSNLPDSLPNVAFKTPDGGIVLLVLNDSDQPQVFAIPFDGRQAEASLPGGAVATYVWPANPFPG